MIRLLRWWLGQLQVRRLATKEVIDAINPTDVEPVARYLWAATSWDRQHTDPDDYDLAAQLWLAYGQIVPGAFPFKAAPLTADARNGLPPPYRDRTPV
jgi:hypothetical protein